MPKFFITSENLFVDQAIITGNDVHHIKSVLRKKPGEKITITSQNNICYQAQIKAITSSEIHLHYLEKLPDTFCLKHQVILAQAIPKHSKMDFILQKTTELGIKEIIPLITQRSFVKSNNLISPTRMQRWQKICQEAAKQCGRNSIPKLHPPIEFSTFCRQKNDNSLPLLFWEKSKNHLKSIIKEQPKKKDTTIILLIGPEGSFSQEEINLALENKFIPVCCLPWILRSETAALYALSIIQYEYNF